MSTSSPSPSPSTSMMCSARSRGSWAEGGWYDKELSGGWFAQAATAKASNRAPIRCFRARTGWRWRLAKAERYPTARTERSRAAMQNWSDIIVTSRERPSGASAGEPGGSCNHQQCFSTDKLNQRFVNQRRAEPRLPQEACPRRALCPGLAGWAGGAHRPRGAPVRDQRSVCTATVMRVAVVSQHSAPKTQAISGNHAGQRQASTNATMVSAPSVRPPRS